MLAIKGTIVTVLLATIPLVAGHGYLVEPPARNVFYPEMNGNCPHCGNGGSKQAPGSICGDGNQFAAGSNYVGTVRAPDRTYTAGSVVQFEVSMNVNHRGHHEFFICDRAIDSDDGAVACFQKFPLLRVPPEDLYNDCVPNDPREDCQPIDPNYPGRWYHPPGMSFHKIHYRIPSDVKCSHCTLLWFWPTANSQAYDIASYSCYKKYLATLKWNFDFCGWACSDSNCPVPYAQDANAPKAPDPAAGPGYEEFRNCADIKIIAGTSGPTPLPTPTTAAPPSPSPAPLPTTVAPPTQAPAPLPTSAPTTAPSPTTACVATPGLNNGVTDTDCAKCPGGYKWWPCNFEGYCTCTEVATSLAQLSSAGKMHSRKRLRHHGLPAVLIQKRAAMDRAELTFDPSDEF